MLRYWPADLAKKIRKKSKCLYIYILKRKNVRFRFQFQFQKLYNTSVYAQRFKNSTITQVMLKLHS